MEYIFVERHVAIYLQLKV